MPRDSPHPGICRDPEIQSLVGQGRVGAGWEFRSQGRAQGPVGNTVSWPGQLSSQNSQALWGLPVRMEGSWESLLQPAQDLECTLRVRENGTEG